jgi:hypothetical protein
MNNEAGYQLSWGHIKGKGEKLGWSIFRLGGTGLKSMLR